MTRQLGFLCPSEHETALRFLDQAADLLAAVHAFYWAHENHGDGAAPTRRAAERLQYEARRYWARTTVGELPLPAWDHPARPRTERKPPRPPRACKRTSAHARLLAMLGPLRRDRRTSGTALDARAARPLFHS